MLLLVSCNLNNNNNEEDENNIQYQMYQGAEMQTVTIQHNNQGYAMEQVVIKNNIPDQYKIAQQKKKNQEEEDKYKTLSKVWDKENLRREEGNQYEEQFRIESYCKEVGYLRCKKVTETCDEDGCNKVDIQCEDKDFKPNKLTWDEYDPNKECDEYKVTVSDSSHDDPYTEKKVHEIVII